MSLDKKRRRTNTPAPKRPLPNNYICIDPVESLMVFDYLNGRREVDKNIVALHLNLCYQCQDAVETLRIIDDAIKEKLSAVGMSSLVTA